MTPKITSEDTHQAWAEVQEDDARRRAENRRYCAHLDRVGAKEAWRKFVEAEHRTIIVKPLTATEKDSQ